jgi:uncharacterized Ntn-hydrolase superfamily protein
MRSLILAVLLVGLLSAQASATFSIVAFDPATGEVGVAVQSRVYGVGQRVAWARGGVGAVATQANSNESYGPDGLELLVSGHSAAETLKQLLEDDELQDQRQLGIVDVAGGRVAWTGGECMNWAGDHQGEFYTCQGNILTGADVVAEMARAFEATAGEELAHRLISALEAGQAAGGDSRGRQSAAIIVGRAHPDYPEYAERYVDIRVADHATPIAELRRLYTMYEGQGLVQAHIRFADRLEGDGEGEAAQVEYDRVGKLLVRTLARDDATAGSLNGLAWFTATHDLYLKEALQAAERAVDLEPEDANILDTLAEVQFRLGMIDSALVTIEHALELNPGDSYLTGQRDRFQGAR